MPAPGFETRVLELDLSKELSTLRSNLQYVEDYIKQKHYMQAVTYMRALVANAVRIIEICAELRGRAK